MEGKQILEDGSRMRASFYQKGNQMVMGKSKSASSADVEGLFKTAPVTERATNPMRKSIATGSLGCQKEGFGTLIYSDSSAWRVIGTG